MESTGYAEKTVYGYDALGRQSRADEYVGNTLTRTTTYSYDLVTGRMAHVSSPEGTINYAFEPGTGQHTRTWTDRTDTTYDYDPLGRLSHVTATKLNGQAVNLVATYAYDDAGNLDTITLPNGVVTDYDYDSLNRLDLQSIREVRPKAGNRP